MFNLNKAIEEWCQSVHTNTWDSDSKMEELRDHVHCEVERLMRNGLSDEQAFQQATDRIGDANALRIEHSKNRAPMAFTIRKTLSDLLPTITLAIGMLLGGLIGAYLGSLAPNDAIAAACYAVGALGGAGIGTVIGMRWRSRQAKNLSHV